MKTLAKFPTAYIEQMFTERVSDAIIILARQALGNFFNIPTSSLSGP